MELNAFCKLNSPASTKEVTQEIKPERNRPRIKCGLKVKTRKETKPERNRPRRKYLPKRKQVVSFSV